MSFFDQVCYFQLLLFDFFITTLILNVPFPDTLSISLFGPKKEKLVVDKVPTICVGSRRVVDLRVSVRARPEDNKTEEELDSHCSGQKSGRRRYVKFIVGQVNSHLIGIIHSTNSDGPIHLARFMMFAEATVQGLAIVSLFVKFCTGYVIGLVVSLILNNMKLLDFKISKLFVPGLFYFKIRKRFFQSKNNFFRQFEIQEYLFF